MLWHVILPLIKKYAIDIDWAGVRYRILRGRFESYLSTTARRSEYSDKNYSYFSVRVPYARSEHFSILWPTAISKKHDKVFIASSNAAYFKTSTTNGAAEARGFLIAWFEVNRDFIQSGQVYSACKNTLFNISPYLHELHAAKGWLRVVLRMPNQARATKEIYLLESALPRLSSQLKVLPAIKNGKKKRLSRILTVIGLIIACFVLILTLPPYDFVDSDFPPTSWMLVYLALFLVILLFSWLRKINWGLSEIFAVAVFPTCLCLWITYWADVVFDKSKTKQETWRITSISPIREKLGPPRKARIVLIKGDRKDQVSIPIDTIEKTQIKVGDKLELNIHSGALGVSWVDLIQKRIGTSNETAVVFSPNRDL